MEINLRTKNDLFAALIIQIKNSLSHLHIISKAPDELSKKYDYVILLGDFNSKPKEKNVKFTKHLPSKKYYQTKYLFQKLR